MKKVNPRSNYAAMRAEKVERAIWHHFDPYSDWQRFRVYTTVEGTPIQEYFPTLEEAREFLAALKSGRDAYPGYKENKIPDHHGNPLLRGVQNVKTFSHHGRYPTHRYVASHGGPQGMRLPFSYDPSDQAGANRALRLALKARRDAEKTHGSSQRKPVK